ncbi:hypothetical protein BH11MYX3_BH11MYX3_40860 [soil metagenome]
MFKLSCLAFAVAACGGSSDHPDAAIDGPDGDATPLWVSGTRLRAVIHAAGDAKRFLTWHDSMCNEDCELQLASDGMQRCLPNMQSTDVYYTDAACTISVGQFPPGQAPTTGYLTTNDFVCDAGTPLYPVRAGITPPAMLYRKNGASCTGGITPTPGYTILPLAPEIAPSTFVGATTAIEPRGPRLSVTVLHAEDGAREVSGITDTTRAMPCFVLAVGTSTVCQSANSAYLSSGTYTDAGCFTHAAAFSRYGNYACSHEPSLVVDYGTGGIPSLFAVGSKLTGTLYGSSGSCMATAPVPNTDYYQIGASVPLTELAQLTRPREGAGRVQLEQVHTPTGELLQTWGFFDTMRNMACHLFLADDLMTRCLPEGSIPALEFTDAACTNAVVSVAPTQTLTAGSYVEFALANGGTSVAQIAAKIAAPASVYLQTNGNPCAPGTVFPSQDYYSTTMVPATDFAPIVRVTE